MHARRSLSLGLFGLGMAVSFGGCSGPAPEGDLETIVDALVERGVDVTE